jgi:hypothetical protein
MTTMILRITNGLTVTVLNTLQSLMGSTWEVFTRVHSLPAMKIGKDRGVLCLHEVERGELFVVVVVEFVCHAACWL